MGSLSVFIYMVIGILVGWYILGHLDAFELLSEELEHYEDYELDDLILSVFLVGLCFLIYGWLGHSRATRESTRRRTAMSEADWLAHHDVLTKLPNRNALDTFVNTYDASTSGALGILSISIDGFRLINDQVSLKGGDVLLQSYAERLNGVKAFDHIFRLGGDEFLAVIQLSDDTDLKQIAHETLNALSPPYAIMGRKVSVTTSIGCSHFPADAAMLNDAIHRSNIAMQIAKRDESEKIVPFRKDMSSYNRDKRALEEDFLDAVKSHRITPYFQPLIKVGTGSIYGYEVLSRWIDPDRGFVSPEIFIGLAEELDVMRELSNSLLRLACQAAKNWPDEQIISFNLSPVQLADPVIIEDFTNILADESVPFSRFEFEVTETAIIQNLTVTRTILDTFRKQGAQIALDDFGTGYSSLSHLIGFNFDRIKVDKFFILGMEKDNKKLMIVKAIMSMARELNLSITAEGIEDKESLELLRDLGCDCGQGYYFSPAVKLEETLSLSRFEV